MSSTHGDSDHRTPSRASEHTRYAISRDRHGAPGRLRTPGSYRGRVAPLEATFKHLWGESWDRGLSILFHGVAASWSLRRRSSILPDLH